MLTTKSNSYTFQKSGIWYFSRRIPQDLKRHYRTCRITYSLRTKSIRDARMRAASDAIFKMWLLRLMRLLCLAMILVHISNKAIAQNTPATIYNKGSAAYGAGDYDNAISIWKQLSDEHDISGLAFFNIGNTYGIKKNDPKAGMDWLKKAAEQNYIPAFNQLGLMYSIGRGAEEDDAEARIWYEKGALAGDPEAQYNLASNLREELPSKAFHWYETAALQGHAGSQFMLGLGYEFGVGTLQNYTLAHMWYNLANANGEDAASSLGRLQKVMTPSAIESAQVMASRCVKSQYAKCSPLD